MNKDVEAEVTIAKVDCTEATALCSAQDVTGYPTLKFFKNGAEKDHNTFISARILFRELK